MVPSQPQVTAPATDAAVVDFMTAIQVDQEEDHCRIDQLHRQVATFQNCLPHNPSPLWVRSPCPQIVGPMTAQDAYLPRSPN